MPRTIFPDRFRVLSGSALKVIATIAMLIAHTATAFHSELNTISFFSVRGVNVSLFWIMEMIGKISFPIFVFLVSEGFRYTRNRFRYGAMLLVFAFISEIPWNLMHYGTVLSFVDQNVLFRLFAGFLALCIIDRFSDKPVIQGLLLIGILIAAYLLNMSYQVAMMLVFYFLSEKPIVRDFINILIIPGTFLYLHSFALIELYNGKRGFVGKGILKYSFYIIYPLHLFVLYLLRYIVFK